MKNITLLIVFAFLTTSCAYKNKLKETLDHNYQTVKVSDNAAMPNADYQTGSEATGQAIGGIVGGLVATIDKGIVDMSSLENPSNELKRQIATILGKKYNLEIIPPAKEAMAQQESLATSELLATYHAGDLVLGVNSIITGVTYPFRMSDYRTIYTAVVRIVDRRTESVIYKSECYYGNEAMNDYKLDQIRQNPKILLPVFKKAKSHCLKQFKREIIKGEK